MEWGQRRDDNLLPSGSISWFDRLCLELLRGRKSSFRRSRIHLILVACEIQHNRVVFVVPVNLQKLIQGRSQGIPITVLQDAPKAPKAVLLANDIQRGADAGMHGAVDSGDVDVGQK